MNDALLEIKELSVDFVSGNERKTALSHISFSIARGSTVAVVGESGSGKTVTSLSVLQLLPPNAKITSGKILFQPKSEGTIDLLGQEKGQIRKIRGNRIAMIFQEPMTSLNPVKTCGSQVMEAILLHKKISEKEARQKTIALFERVKLPHASAILRRYPHQLSGGQKQRVMIAMAISCEPELLIADEPTTALDVTVQKTILELIADLQKDTGMSILYITHDLTLVSEIADEVIVMYRGKIMETGKVKQIFTTPGNNYTRGLINCRPGPEHKGKTLPVIKDFLEQGEANIQEFAYTTKRNSTVAEDIAMSVKNLTVSFPAKKNFFGKTLREFHAVDDVSFAIKKGETLGLVGESGCGKTTLGRALLRLVEPASGQILFNGTDLLNLPAETLRQKRKEIQMVFQDPYGSMNPRMTIGEAIREPMRVHGLLKNEKSRKDKVIELLEKVDIHADNFGRYPHEFSGGQRQRICIARALAINPEFIICDESVSALDVSVQAQVLNLLTTLKNELGFTCLFISHDLGVVHYISDRIMVMNAGKIEESGTADEIFYHPQRTYTRQLIDAVPKMKAF